MGPCQVILLTVDQVGSRSINQTHTVTSVPAISALNALTSAETAIARFLS